MVVVVDVVVIVDDKQGMAKCPPGCFGAPEVAPAANVHGLTVHVHVHDYDYDYVHVVVGTK